MMSLFARYGNFYSGNFHLLSGSDKAATSAKQVVVDQLEGHRHSFREAQHQFLLPLFIEAEGKFHLVALMVYLL